MLMISFVDAFFRTGGEQFGFLAYDELVRRVYADDLDCVLANCIAAWATKWVRPHMTLSLTSSHPCGTQVRENTRPRQTR